MNPRNNDPNRPDVNDKPTSAPESGHQPKKPKSETEKDLDHGLKETFPASDPVSINPGAD
ncbi:MAG TPA: hypothetical protein VF138_08050 [Caulobacteraceae bacterium]